MKKLLIFFCIIASTSTTVFAQDDSCKTHQTFKKLENGENFSFYFNERTQEATVYVGKKQLPTIFSISCIQLVSASPSKVSLVVDGERMSIDPSLEKDFWKKE